MSCDLSPTAVPRFSLADSGWVCQGVGCDLILTRHELPPDFAPFKLVKHESEATCAACVAGPVRAINAYRLHDGETPPKETP